MQAERRVPVTLPNGQAGEGWDVPVEESNERWSEFTLQDGTVIRGKFTMSSAIRVDGQFDAVGNPIYVANMSPVIAIVSVREQYRKKAQ